MKRKHEIIIPKGTRYLSEIASFELPNGILDKELTGCGATTLALTDGYPTIIASPRKALVLNKTKQFPVPQSFAVVSGVYKQDVRKYLDDCIREGIIPKIITTYDSLSKVSSSLTEEERNSFRLVIDEFHNILNDSVFKALTEMAVLDECLKYNYVTYLSATPMLEKYIDSIEHFKNVEYYQLKWNEEDILEFRLYDNPTQNPLGAICEVIKAYKQDGFVDFDGIRSYEAVIFLNSVSNIINVIHTCSLTPEDCNIVISNNKDNNSLLDAFGIDKTYNYIIGEIPLSGENNKMFTFCTSTAYQGCDFHSNSAMTFIVSDSNIPNTVVDIFTELPQIIGRQRDDENPFRNKAAFYYKTSTFHASEEAMKSDLLGLDKMTKEIIDSINSILSIPLRDNMAKTYCVGMHFSNEQGAFVYYDETEHRMKLNFMARNGFVWRCDVKSMYKDKDRVRQLLVKLHKVNVENSSDNGGVGLTLSRYTSTVFTDAMKRYCEIQEKRLSSESTIERAVLASQLNESIEGSAIWSRCKYYYDLLGAEKIRALSYQESKIKKESAKISKQHLIQQQVDAHYSNGQRIARSKLKLQLQSIYDSLGLKVKAKATDIENYGFEYVEYQTTIDGKRVHGYELKKKQY